MNAPLRPWAHTRAGRPVDLLQPTPQMVDFRAIADALAQLNRYAGNAEKPVSVALHTLIVFDAAEEQDKPHALLHDAHEAHIGDITTPTAQALGQIARLYGDEGRTVQLAIMRLKSLHDAAIYAAAGLSAPDPQRAARIRRADIAALNTERRDFLSPSARPWASEIEAVPPLRKRYRMRAAPDVADELYAKFCRYLPALIAREA
jgi:hypothetical protein